MPRLRWWLLVVVTFVSLVDTAAAQPRPQPPSVKTPADVLGSAQQSAADLQQLRAALRGPDASARVAAFTAMIESNNPSLMAMAISEGRASGDVVLRDLAVRAAFREVKTFTPEPTSELVEKVLGTYQALAADRHCLFITIADYDWKAGAFKTTSDAYGQVSAGRLSFGSGCCQGNLMATEGTWQFEGIVTCAWYSHRLRERMRLHIR